MGVFGDWENPYLTMNFPFEADIIRALGKIVANGHLQRGFKPVYWSVVGASALAEAEVEYQDKVSYSIDVGFPVVDQEAFLAAMGGAAGTGSISVVIWTTTPWTCLPIRPYRYILILNMYWSNASHQKALQSNVYCWRKNYTNQRCSVMALKSLK